jgi:hypothetical protein
VSRAELDRCWEFVREGDVLTVTLRIRHSHFAEIDGPNFSRQLNDPSVPLGRGRRAAAQTPYGSYAAS